MLTLLSSGNNAWAALCDRRRSFCRFPGVIESHDSSAYFPGCSRGAVRFSGLPQRIHERGSWNRYLAIPTQFLSVGMDVDVDLRREGRMDEWIVGH